VTRPLTGQGRSAGVPQPCLTNRISPNPLATVTRPRCGWPMPPADFAARSVHALKSAHRCKARDLLATGWPRELPGRTRRQLAGTWSASWRALAANPESRPGGCASRCSPSGWHLMDIFGISAPARPASSPTTSAMSPASRPGALRVLDRHRRDRRLQRRAAPTPPVPGRELGGSTTCVIWLAWEWLGPVPTGLPPEDRPPRPSRGDDAPAAGRPCPATCLRSGPVLHDQWAAERVIRAESHLVEVAHNDPVCAEQAGFGVGDALA
jgi:hypothetical protein